MNNESRIMRHNMNHEIEIMMMSTSVGSQQDRPVDRHLSIIPHFLKIATSYQVTSVSNN